MSAILWFSKAFCFVPPDAEFLVSLRGSAAVVRPIRSACMVSLHGSVAVVRLMQNAW